MATQQFRPEPGRLRVLGAAAVHAYTAMGAVLAFIAVREVIAGDYRAAFILIFVATMVDATDGALARLARVKQTLPSVDGARLDDIVDYLTFVFVPMLLLVEAGDVPSDVALPVAAVVLLSSAYGFSSTDAKTDDCFFTGFPSYWNIVALYLHIFRGRGCPPAVNAAMLVVFSALIFVRVGYVYPSRTPVLRRLTLAAAAVWGAFVAAMIWALPYPSMLLITASLGFPVYYVVLSLVLQARRRAAIAS